MKKRINKALNIVRFIGKSLNWLLFKGKDKSEQTAFVFRVSKWKQPYVEAFLPEYKLLFVPATQWLFLLTLLLKRQSNIVFMIWGALEDTEIKRYAKKHNIPIFRIEDGFVRSKGLGAMLTPPYSLCIDKKGIYFDSSRPSDLEGILSSYDFSVDVTLMNTARKCMDLLIHLGVSKYNHLEKKSIIDIYGLKRKKRILVIGQVEDDASILKGADKKWTNNDLVRLAYLENPDAEIIYKPHPDVLTGRRPRQSDPRDIMDIAKVIEEPLSLIDSFQTIDHVYTITSLSGFEALIRGISVTTVGAPFYSGWGLTDDRQLVSRRQRNLTIEELFAGAYLLYPRYADPIAIKRLTLEETIMRIVGN